jgi:hypothetical protein
VDDHSTKHKELSTQLTSWWRAQTDFKTKRALADFLKVHPDTVGDYFSGRVFPRSDIANRLFELTKIACLQPHIYAIALSGMVPQDSSPVALLPPAPVVASIEKPPEPDMSSTHGLAKDRFSSPKSPEAIPGQLPSEVLRRGERYPERSVIISLQRTTCPFCAHHVSSFRDCVYCGQHFVWANVPVERDKPS